MHRRRKVSGTCSVAMPGWSELPSDILALIFELLPFIDTIRAKAVCSSWLSAWKAYLQSFSGEKSTESRVPLLMFEPIKCRRPLRFFHPVTNTLYWTKGSRNNGRCIGSLRSWLAILDRKFRPFLLNPFTKERIDLPSFETLGEGYYDYFKKVDKAAMWIDPETRDYGVAVLIIPFVVCYCKCGDNKWTTLFAIGGEDFHDDLWEDIFFGANHILYALSKRGCLVEWNLHWRVQGSYHVRRLEREFSVSEEEVREMSGVLTPEGEIVLVEKVLQGSWTLTPTKLIRVYRQDQSGNSWRRVRSLDGCALFLGSNESSLVPVPDGSGYKRNSVYLLQCCNDVRSGRYLGRKPGIYKLEDDSFQWLDFGVVVGTGKMEFRWVLPSFAEL